MSRWRVHVTYGLGNLFQLQQCQLRRSGLSGAVSSRPTAISAGSFSGATKSAWCLHDAITMRRRGHSGSPTCKALARSEAFMTIALIVLTLIFAATEQLHMALYRVKVFFMHKHERAAAAAAVSAAVLTEFEWTEGYVMGVIDEGAISGLVDQGLVVTPIEMLITTGSATRSTRRRAPTPSAAEAGSVAPSPESCPTRLSPPRLRRRDSGAHNSTLCA